MPKRSPDAFRIAIVDSGEHFNHDEANTLKYLFTKNNNDIMFHETSESLEDVINFDPNITIIMTPTEKDEKTGAVIAAQLESEALQLLAKTSGGVVIRTPLPIEIIDRLCATNDKVVYYPQFFGEGKQENQTFHILGGSHSSVGALNEILRSRSTAIMGNVVMATAVEAAMIEQGIAAITGLKYMFLNQLHDFMSEYGGDYHLVSNYINTHQGTGHTNDRVPNKDFKRGIQDLRVDAIKNLMNMDKELFTTLENFDIINTAYTNRED
tara:strand:- start:749 stop:1549 length:801 start_codon:yes stop_codon:yes gene_type:complete